MSAIQFLRRDIARSRFITTDRLNNPLHSIEFIQAYIGRRMHACMQSVATCERLSSILLDVQCAAAPGRFAVCLCPLLLLLLVPPPPPFSFVVAAVVPLA
jgi:hypothetical protein